MDFSNLEEAISILSNPMAKHGAEIKKQANDYLVAFTGENYTNWRDMFNLFISTQSEETRFYVLQILCDIANTYWAGLPPIEQAAFCECTLEFIKEKYDCIVTVPHYLSKYSYLMCLCVRNGYPTQFNIFEPLVTLVKESENSLVFLKLLFSILEQINDEIIERESGTTQDDIVIANRIKDAMRDKDVPIIVDLCRTVLENHSQVDNQLVIGAIDTLADLIDWNTLSLFEPCFDPITQFLEMKEYQQNALYCFYSFMNKGMDPAAKITLIKDMGIIEKIRGFGIDVDDLELTQSISDIITKLGLLILEIIDSTPVGTPYLADAQGLILELLGLILFTEPCLFANADVKSAQHLVKFVNQIVLYLRKIETLGEDLTQILLKIQDVCIQKTEYPDWCTFEDGKLGEEEENFIELRLELVNLYSNTLLIADLKVRALKIIEEKLVELKSNIQNYTQNQIELPLFLLTHMNSIIMREDKDLVNDMYQMLIGHVMETDFLAANSKVVSILYFEICVKFASYFLHFPAAIPQVLENFLSERGVLSPIPKLASRSSYFLLRFIDRLKIKLGEFAELLFTKTQEVIKLAEAGKTKLSSTDIENFYEIIGSLLDGFELPPEKVKDTLQYYFELIYNKIISMPSQYFEGVIEFIRRLNQLIKSLSKTSASESKSLLIEMCANLYKIFERYISNPIQECTVFVQKSLALVGSDLLEGVNAYLECLLNQNNHSCLDTTIRLLNYTAIEMDEDGLKLVDRHIITIFEQLEIIGFPETSRTDLAKDKISLFSKFMKLLQTSAQKNSLVFIADNSGQIFEKLINLLVFMIKQNIEKQFRKDALLILRTILIEFSGCTLGQIKHIHLGNKDKIEERKISDNSNYKNVWDFLVETVRKTSFDIFQVLNPADPVDVNCIYLISLIHVVLLNIDSEFASTYQDRILEIKPDIEFQELADNLESFSQDKLKVAAFKHNITKLFRKSK